MKTERRHELQKNQLADALGHELDYLRPYYKTILGVIIAVVAVGATIAILSSQRAAKNAAAWGSFYDAVADSTGDKMPKRLEGISETFDGTKAGLWAELVAGDLKLQTGSELMMSDRKEAEVNLDQARRHFQAVIDQAKNEPMLMRRARFGLAQTLEAMNNPDDAVPIYEELAKENPDDAFGKAAAERLVQVERLSERGWYSWFAKHTPAPPSDNPLEGLGPLGDLPSTNNLNSELQAPGIIGSELMEEPTGDEPPIEFDAPKTKKDDTKDDAFPVEPAPSDEKKADEPPADAPADDKQTDEPADPPAADVNQPGDPAPDDAPPADEKKADGDAPATDPE